jgi:hypothetical protein
MKCNMGRSKPVWAVESGGIGVVVVTPAFWFCLWMYEQDAAIAVIIITPVEMAI